MGIDLDSTNKCSGDPVTCKADPCNTERCPMANSYVQQLLNGTEITARRLAFVFDLVDALVDTGVITGEVLARAKSAEAMRYHRPDPEVSRALAPDSDGN